MKTSLRSLTLFGICITKIIEVGIKVVSEGTLFRLRLSRAPNFLNFDF